MKKTSPTRIRAKARRSKRRARARRAGREGVALLLSIITIAILGIMVADLAETSTTGFSVAIANRDALRAEYLAKSGLGLTRLVVAQGPALARLIGPVYSQAGLNPPSVMPVWNIAPILLRPFCGYAEMSATSSSSFDLASAKGLDDMPGTCDVRAVAENSKINVSDPLHANDDQARRGVMMQLFAATGGFASPGPYDAFFAHDDADGVVNTRLDTISSIVDWWDMDTQRTSFDPGANQVTTGGSEDDPYSRYADRYHAKNAPFDSLEELRLVRGVTDDFWATFVDPEPEDMSRRMITVYGSGGVNPNEADPIVIINRLCSFIPENAFCTSGGEMERLKFIGLVRTARSLLPVPLFGTPSDFLDFMKGQGRLRTTLQSLSVLLGDIIPAPLTIPPAKETEILGAFITAARILSVESTGLVGRTRVRLRAVVNFDPAWRGPPPTNATTPMLGVVHHYRIE